jgi:uncharacterized FlaG/YvyC family protein
MIFSSTNSSAAQVSIPAGPFPSGPSRALSDDERVLIHAVKAVNASEMLGQDNELTFVLDPAVRRAVVRIVNRHTREVVQQIPSEYVLRMPEEMKRG